MVLFYGMFLTTRTKVGMMRQSYNGIDRINFRDNMKQFTSKTKEKNNITSIVRQKLKHHVTFLGMTSANFSLVKQDQRGHRKNNSIAPTMLYRVSKKESIITLILNYSLH